MPDRFGDCLWRTGWDPFPGPKKSVASKVFWRGEFFRPSCDPGFLFWRFWMNTLDIQIYVPPMEGAYRHILGSKCILSRWMSRDIYTMTAAGGSVGSDAGGAGCAGGGSNSFSRRSLRHFVSFWLIQLRFKLRNIHSGNPIWKWKSLCSNRK